MDTKVSGTYLVGKFLRVKPSAKTWTDKQTGAVNNFAAIVVLVGDNTLYVNYFRQADAELAAGALKENDQISLRVFPKLYDKVVGRDESGKAVVKTQLTWNGLN
jgi:hypothetical protein